MKQTKWIIFALMLFLNLATLIVTRDNMNSILFGIYVLLVIDLGIVILYQFRSRNLIKDDGTLRPYKRAVWPVLIYGILILLGGFYFIGYQLLLTVSILFQSFGVLGLILIAAGYIIARWAFRLLQFYTAAEKVKAERESRGNK